MYLYSHVLMGAIILQFHYKEKIHNHLLYIHVHVFSMQTQYMPNMVNYTFRL